jgi:pSer/pThr/pTyr-binding forkhead associated (FHA) protein
MPGAKLVLSDTAEIDLGGEEITVGRKDFLQDIPPEEAKFISREHVRIFREDDAYFIVDEGSSNGTTLNGDEIRGRGKKELHHDDEIILADTVTVRFKIHS